MITLNSSSRHNRRRSMSTLAWLQLPPTIALITITLLALLLLFTSTGCTPLQGDCIQVCRVARDLCLQATLICDTYCRDSTATGVTHIHHRRLLELVDSLTQLTTAVQSLR